MIFLVGFTEKLHDLESAFIDVKVNVAPFKIGGVGLPDFGCRISGFNELPAFEPDFFIDEFFENKE